MNLTSRIANLKIEYSDIIKDIIIIYFDETYWKAKFILIDDSQFCVSEYWQEDILVNYTYYWLDEENQLII